MEVFIQLGKSKGWNITSTVGIGGVVGVACYGVGTCLACLKYYLNHYSMPRMLGSTWVDRFSSFKLLAKSAINRFKC